MSEKTAKVREAISFFENILRTMPHDRVSLEYLGGAYEQVGDYQKACDSWKHLVEVLLKADKKAAAVAFLPRLDPYLADGEIYRLAGQLRDIEQELAARPVEDEEAPDAESAGASRVELDPAQLHMAAAFEEMNLAWIFHERGFLDVAEYEKLTVDLTEIGQGVPEVPISTLCSLEQLHPDRSDQAVLLLAETYKIVPLRLEIFDITPDVAATLPAIFVRIKGAIPFAKLGNNLMVALLNPANKQLRTEVEELSQCRCTYYLAHPANLGHALSAFPVEN